MMLSALTQLIELSKREIESQVETSFSPDAEQNSKPKTGLITQDEGIPLLCVLFFSLVRSVSSFVSYVGNIFQEVNYTWRLRKVRCGVSWISHRTHLLLIINAYCADWKWVGWRSRPDFISKKNCRETTASMALNHTHILLKYLATFKEFGGFFIILIVFIYLFVIVISVNWIMYSHTYALLTHLLQRKMWTYYCNYIACLNSIDCDALCFFFVAKSANKQFRYVNSININNIWGVDK